MISLSTEPQFSAEDVLEIPAGVGRTNFEFDMNLIEVCQPLFQRYSSNEQLASDLIRARVIRDSDMSLSTQDAVIVRFKSQKASINFIQRLNSYVHKCLKLQRDLEKRPRSRRRKVSSHPVFLLPHSSFRFFEQSPTPSKS